MTNTRSIVSFVLGLVALFVPIPFILGIVAIVQGRIAREEIGADSNQTGDGFAVAGIVLGWIDVVLSAILIIIFILLLAARPA